MTKHRVLLTILSFLFLCSPQQPAIASELQGKVVEVVDGETVVVSSANHLIRVHLYTVSAPRKEHPLAVVIRQHLADFVLGKLVSIRYSIMESDLINGLVFLNGNDIGLQMVRDGAASYNSKYERELSDSTRQLYIESERAARNEKLGIWRTGLSMSSPQTQAQAEENANTQELTRTSPNAVGPKEPSKYRSSQEPANSLKNDDTALSPISSTSKPQIYTSGADAGTTSEGPSSVSTYAEKASASPFQAQLIPRNSKVYIA